MKQSLATQTTIDYYNCDPSIINNVSLVKLILEKAATLMNLTIVNTTIHEFSPMGISGVLVIEESHIAIHTWPEHKYVALDFFTCNTSYDLTEGLLWIKKELKSNKMEKQLAERGFLKNMSSSNDD